jgi:Mycobacterium membrane protein
VYFTTALVVANTLPDLSAIENGAGAGSACVLGYLKKHIRFMIARRGDTVTNDDGRGFYPVPPPDGPPPGYPGQFGPPPGYPPYPPPSSAPPAQPAKKRWPWIVGSIIAAVVLAVVVGLVVVLTVAKDEPRAVTVTYEVTGPPGSVEVTYWGADGKRSNPVTVTLPWKTEVTMRGDDTYVSLSVERPKSSEEPAKCRITAGGKVIQENQAEGIFLSCTGHLGGG